MEKGIVTEIDLFGQGIIKTKGKVYFVKNALPKEEVLFSVEKTTKNCGFGVAREILTLSPYRIKAPCPHFGVCGGCHFQHCDYETEMYFKSNHVKNLLSRMAGLSAFPFEPMSEPAKIFGYRNKVTWHMKEGKTGFYKENSRDFLPINRCMLLDKPLNVVTEAVNALGCKTLREVILRCNEKGEVALSFFGSMPKTAINQLVASCSALVDVSSAEGSGGKSFAISLGERSFLTSPQSFFQVNTIAANALLKECNRFLGDEHRKTLLDLYCGVGTVGICFSDRFSKIYGVESYAPAIAFAKKNAAKNGVNAQYVTAKAEEELSHLLQSMPQADCVVVDPPRKGLHPTVTDTLCRYGAETLLYISCDPATLSRDLKLLTQTYSPVHIKPFDLFPRTSHVESVVLMSRVDK